MQADFVIYAQPLAQSPYALPLFHTCKHVHTGVETQPHTPERLESSSYDMVFLKNGHSHSFLREYGPCKKSSETAANYQRCCFHILDICS